MLIVVVDMVNCEHACHVMDRMMDRVTSQFTGRVGLGVGRGLGRGEQRDPEEGLGDSPAGEAAGGGHGEEVRQGEERQRGGVDAQALLTVAEQERRLGVLAAGGLRAAGSYCRPLSFVTPSPLAADLCSLITYDERTSTSNTSFF